jgi:hypothetical protein
MEFYAVLTAATAAIVALALVLWFRTGHVGFPVGIGLFYYWSLHGAWSVILDRTGGDSGKRYDYLTVKMFPIDLDGDYFLTLIYYALFIILMELTLLACLGSENNNAPVQTKTIRVSHPTVFVVAVLSWLVSYIIMQDQLKSAADLGMSAYIATRGGLGEMHPLFTAHQILNRFAIFSLAIGCAVYLTGRTGKWLTGSTGLSYGFLYGGLALGIFAYLAMLGNKNELLSALILGAMVYIGNSQKVRWAPGAVLGAVAFAAIASIDFIRGIPLIELSDRINWWDALMWAPEIRSSNEAFAAHFSLYGVLHFHAGLTYGDTFTALAASIVPRLFWPDRPEGSYIQYAETLGIYEGPTGQGYAIHHATGWYLNFGLWGLIAGAVLLGAIWAKCYHAHRAVCGGDRGWRNVLALIAPAGFVSFVPPLVRAGPDAYKGLILEAFVIPTVIILLVSVRWADVFRIARRPYRVREQQLPTVEA